MSEPQPVPGPQAQEPGTPRNWARTVRGAAITAALMLTAGFTIAALTQGPDVAPPLTTGSQALTIAADVLGTYAHSPHADQGAGQWPADLPEFRQYTRWLAEQPGQDALDPAALATVTYVLTKDGPCVETYVETQSTAPAATHWTGGKITPGRCGPAAVPAPR